MPEKPAPRPNSDGPLHDRANCRLENDPLQVFPEAADETVLRLARLSVCEGVMTILLFTKNYYN